MMGLQTPSQRVKQQFAAQIVSVSIPLCMWSQGKTNDVPNLRQSSPSCNRRHRLTSISQKNIENCNRTGRHLTEKCLIDQKLKTQATHDRFEKPGVAIKGRCSSDVRNSHIGVVRVALADK